jgi:archaemetzincin
MNRLKWFIASYLLLFCLSCHSQHKTKIIALQPFQDFSASDTKYILKHIRPFFPETIVLAKRPLPSSAYVKPRNRYRADSLIHILKRSHGSDTVIVGLTHYDISTTKNNVQDWGVMGLGYRPGNACVISTFRLKKENKLKQLLKVVLHEIGHTQGLPHCNDKTCLMRDAEGGNPLNEEKDFCADCKHFLEKKGMIIDHQ